jgi:hypothetical protein
MKQIDDEQLLTEQPWLQQAVDDLRRPVPSDVAVQLRTVRREVLAQQQPKSANHRAPVFGWGMAFAAVAGVLVVGAVLLNTDIVTTTTSQPDVVAESRSEQLLLEDLPIMAGQDDLQFYQELEFLQWLEQEGGLDAQG